MSLFLFYLLSAKKWHVINDIQYYIIYIYIYIYIYLFIKIAMIKNLYQDIFEYFIVNLKF